MGVCKSGITTRNVEQHHETCPWKVGTFWGMLDLQFASWPILVDRHVVVGWIICFVMHGAWLGLCIIQCTTFHL